MTTIAPQADREWWPFAFVDSVMPPGRDTPDGWLCRLADGAHAFGDPDAKEDFFRPRSVAEGEIVGFVWGEDAGEAVLTIADDGAYACNPPLPSGGYIHVVGDPETGAESVESLVELLKEYGDDEGEHTLVRRRSSDEIPFRFTALDGPPRFVRVEPATVQ